MCLFDKLLLGVKGLQEAEKTFVTWNDEPIGRYLNQQFTTFIKKIVGIDVSKFLISESKQLLNLNRLDCTSWFSSFHLEWTWQRLSPSYRLVD
jgi:hypothetical protein